MKFNRKRAAALVQRSKFKAMAVVGTAVAFSPLAAMASGTQLPATVDDAAAFMNAKGLIAIAVASAITLIVLGLKGAKLPRRG